MWDDFLLFVAVGFAAQMIDGAIGMAYGVTSAAVLLSFGVPPATTSACIHAAETVTTAASGFAHWRFGNVDRALLWRLAVPGMIGGVIGAIVLTSVPADVIRPIVNVYLMLLGGVILLRALIRRTEIRSAPRGVAPLGFAGGFLDSIGGGGWGAIVTSSLLVQGVTARHAVGTVNLSEFFVTASVSATFLATIGLDLWPIIAGLVLGGVLAAPFAALAIRHLPDTVVMVLVGAVVMILSIRGLIIAFT